MTNDIKKNYLKYISGWLLVLLLRLIPWRPPSVEPIMAALMPYSKRYGYLGGFLFAFFSMAIYDIAQNRIGIWTWATAAVYGGVGMLAAWYFKDRKATAIQYAMFGMLGSIVFDALTGLTIGPIFAHQPFMEALVGQIPFSIRHAASNGLFGMVLSPLIDRWIVRNEHLTVYNLSARLMNTMR